jgi:pimeloyl-ACP methyl ester carboxylesterase
MNPITFSSNGYTLAGNLSPAVKPQKLAFLLIQGWTGHQNLAAAQALTKLGFTSMTYDMRGNGESEGNLTEFSRADFISDAVVAYDYLKDQLGPDAAIGVVGSSFGSYTAVLLPEQRPVICLSLRVPASYPDEGFNDPQLPQSETDELTAWRNKPLDYSRNHAFKALHSFTGKVQIVEADRDELVSHQAVQNYADSVADKSNLEHILLPDAPHRLENDRLKAEYVRLLTDWAKQFRSNP